MMETYRVPYNGTVTLAGGDTDLLILQPATDKPVRIKGWTIGQQTQKQDANEAELRITVRHMTATVTVTGGTPVTPVPNHPSVDTAAGLTATCNCPTVATTTGTSKIAEELTWNNRNNPWERWIPEDDRLIAKNGEALIVRLEGTPALPADTVFGMTFLVEELN